MTISGKMAISIVKKTKIKKKGIAAFAIRPMLSPVNPWMTKRLNPTGGVIWAISTTSTTKTPNQIGLYPT